MTEKSLNQRLAEVLGWTDIREQDAWDDAYTYAALYGTPPEGVDNLTIPDYEHDLNAVAAVLERHDITLRIDFGVPEAVRILPEWRESYPQPAPEFRVCDADVWHESGRHADVPELAAMALLQWLVWEKEEQT